MVQLPRQELKVDGSNAGEKIKVDWKMAEWSAWSPLEQVSKGLDPITAKCLFRESLGTKAIKNRLYGEKVHLLHYLN